MQKLSAHTLMCLLACATAACSNDLEQKEIPVQGGEEGERITVTATAGMPQGQPSTRLEFTEEGSKLKLTWRPIGDSKGPETFSVFSGTNNAHPSTFTMVDDKNATFTGEIIPTEGATYYAIYPALTAVADASAAPTAIPLDMTGQEGKEPDESKTYMYSSSTYTSSDALNFNFTPLTSIVKATLKFPAALTGKTASDVTFTATDGLHTKAEANITESPASYNNQTPGALTLSNTFILSSDANAETIVYLQVLPNKLTDFKVMATVDGKSYIGTVSTNATITAGKMYTKTVEMMQVVSSMKFTVKVEDGSLGFSIPFPTDGTTPATITVDWGDGNTSTVASGTTLSESDEFNHKYLIAGEYTITITSDQTDAAQQQIPTINFYNSRRENSNASKLIRVDTPLLNTGTTKFIDCFYKCSNLQSIPEELFANNTEATNFNSCFYGCTNLQNIPEGLFANNTEATNFNSCFYGCTNLQNIPEGLFANNTKVTEFSCCFQKCTNLQNIPEGLFANNTKVTEFNGCFQECTNLPNIPEGLFANNTETKYISTCFSNCTNLQNIPEELFANNKKIIYFYDCFHGCSNLQSIPEGLFANNTKVTNFSYCFYQCYSLQSIPEGLFANNTEATNFAYCFKYCSKLTLNEKIFTKDTPPYDRFVGKEMDFYSCFQNVGANLAPDAAGTAPDLWNYNKGGATWATTNCFKGANTNLSNWGDISTDWGGPKVTN